MTHSETLRLLSMWTSLGSCSPTGKREAPWMALLGSRTGFLVSCECEVWDWVRCS